MLEGWTTVRWARGLYGWARRALHPRTLWPLCASWLITIAFALGGVAFLVDGSILMRAGAAPYALFIALVAAALGCFSAILILPVIVVLASITNAIAISHERWRPRWRSLWPLPLAVAAYFAPRLYIDSYGVERQLYQTMTACWSVALFVLALLGRVGTRWYARVIAVALGGAALVADVTTPRAMYRDQHDLASLVTVLAVMVLLTPMRRRLRNAPVALLRTTLIALFALALTVSSFVEHALPGWRSRAIQYGRYEPRLARALRSAVDFDGDHFSPIAWGGDCDDFDARRNPLAHEEGIGRDDNCNGYSLAAQPTAADRGLAPAAGSPDLPPQTADLALLITVDCLST
ncbi:MAG: sulfatase family protein, partial [bacterium]|nr:sulfatase family protein [bacterium]